MSHENRAQPKKIIFLSDKNRYLEHSIYCLLAEELKRDFKLIYLDADIPHTIVHNKSSLVDKAEKMEHFDVYEKVKLPSHSVNKLKGFPQLLFLIRVLVSLKRFLLSTIEKHDPSLIIRVSPNTYNTRVLMGLKKNIKTVYIQPATIAHFEMKTEGLKFLIKKMFFNKILGVPYIKENNNFINSSPGTYFLLWSKVWVNQLKVEPNSKLYFVGNLLFDSFFRAKHLGSRGSVKKVMVVLNKEKHIGIENWDTYANFYMQLATACKNFKFIFKVHPLGDLERCRTVFEGFNVTVNEIEFDDIDLLLTHWSSLSLAAVAHGVPTILANPKGNFDLSRFNMQNYGAIIEEYTDFERIANELLLKDSVFLEIRANFIRSHLTYDDSESLTRAKNILVSIVED